MMDYSIEYPWDADGDAYVVGNLLAAHRDAEKALGGALAITGTERDGWHYVECAEGDYWGSGSTEEAALRHMFGAMLDPRKGS